MKIKCENQHVPVVEGNDAASVESSGRCSLGCLALCTRVGPACVCVWRRGVYLLAGELFIFLLRHLFPFEQMTHPFTKCSSRRYCRVVMRRTGARSNACFEKVKRGEQRATIPTQQASSPSPSLLASLPQYAPPPRLPTTRAAGTAPPRPASARQRARPWRRRTRG